jgi:hypothetical protein
MFRSSRQRVVYRWSLIAMLSVVGAEANPGSSPRPDAVPLATASARAAPSSLARPVAADKTPADRQHLMMLLILRSRTDRYPFWILR